MIFAYFGLFERILVFVDMIVLNDIKCADCSDTEFSSCNLNNIFSQGSALVGGGGDRPVEHKPLNLVTTNDNPELSLWGIYDNTILEAPVYLGRSQIETSFIGAFTFINNRSVRHVTTNCAIDCQSIGRYCMIAHGVNIGFAGHPAGHISAHLLFRYDSKCDYANSFRTILNDDYEVKSRNVYIEDSRRPLPKIGNDVWIGYGASIMNGVTVSDGTIVGACSVVTRNTEPYSIVAGNPARTIRKRFADNDIQILLDSKWWEFEPEIMRGLDMAGGHETILRLQERVCSGKYKKFHPPLVRINNQTGEITIEKAQ